MEIKSVTEDDLKSIKALEGVLRIANIPNMKPTEAASIAGAMQWFGGFMKKVANSWVDNNPVTEVKPTPKEAVKDEGFKVKAYSPGKMPKGK